MPVFVVICLVTELGWLPELEKMYRTDNGKLLEHGADVSAPSSKLPPANQPSKSRDSRGILAAKRTSSMSVSSTSAGAAKPNTAANTRAATPGRGPVTGAGTRNHSSAAAVGGPFAQFSYRGAPKSASVVSTEVPVAASSGARVPLKPKSVTVVASTTPSLPPIVPSSLSNSTRITSGAKVALKAVKRR
jgi:hypothetical protein